MQILLASAKTMREYCKPTGLTLSQPRFQSTAVRFAKELGRFDGARLSELFSCSLRIGEQNRERFRLFGTDEAEIMPAILAYNGQAYKYLKADLLDQDELLWADSHLWISSMLYGMLRPLNGINTYRMEGGFGLISTEKKKIAEYWRPHLTDLLIESTLADDGILIYLDTEEYRKMFDWKRVTAAIPTIIEPQFNVIVNGKRTTQAVWAKSCRGAMARYIISNRIEDVAELRGFACCGFSFLEQKEDNMIFCKGVTNI